MRSNGFIVVIDLALKEINDSMLNAYRKTLILGAFRENVYFTPGLDLVTLNPSLSHFYHPRLPGGIIPFVWPGPKAMGNFHFRKSIKKFLAGKKAAAFVQLGRVSHLLTDMACPVHAQSVFHSTDPFEWAVESMKDELLHSSIPSTCFDSSVSSLIGSLARFTQDFQAEKTNNPWGYILKRTGILSKIKSDLVRSQVKTLIPQAASHTIRLFELFLRGIGSRQIVPSEETIMDETLQCLEMSRTGLDRWFRQMEQFCLQHGGRNHYSEILDLIAECRGRAFASLANARP